MNESTVEALIWVDAEHARAQLAQFGVPIRQLLPPRLALVKVDADALPALREQTGVQAVFTPGEPVDVPNLSEAEAMFVTAWQERAKPKQRLGDGLAWDAPGYRPPDPPPTAEPVN